MTRKIRTPRVLTVDDGEKLNNRHKSSDYGFVFSDNIEDWQTTRSMQHKRKLGRIIMKNYWESKSPKDVLPEKEND